jgi:uncharacterized RDD family membrane protein YckC
MFYAAPMARRNPLERLPQMVAEAVVTQIVNMIDVNEIVGRVDVNELLSRVDINALISRVDINAIADQIDVDAIADRIDVGRILERTEFSDIIAKSTSSILGEFLDVLRRQAVAVDDVLDRLNHHAQRFAQFPAGPTITTTIAASDPENREGNFAGGFSRFAAMTIDAFASWGLFLLAVSALQATLSLFLSRAPHVFHHDVWALVLGIPFFFFYFAWPWSLTGRTVGMAFVGIRVASLKTHRVTLWRAALRTIVLPFSILLLGLGLIGIFRRADRRTAHDQAANTCVVYSWDARGGHASRPATTSHVA